MIPKSSRLPFRSYEMKLKSNLSVGWLQGCTIEIGFFKHCPSDIRENVENLWEIPSLVIAEELQEAVTQNLT